jgi:hypothetical protein
MPEMRVDFSGTWKANLEISKFSGPTPKELIVKIKHSESDLHETMVARRADGSESSVVFRCSTNGGKESCFLNDRQVRGKTHWEGSELIIETWIPTGNREAHFRDCWSLSSDRNTLKMEHRDDDLAAQLTLLDREQD